MALCSRAGLARFCSVASLLVTLVASAMHAQAAADCDGGTTEHCLVLGDKYRDGVDVAKDPARAAAKRPSGSGATSWECYVRKAPASTQASSERGLSGWGLPTC